MLSPSTGINIRGTVWSELGSLSFYIPCSRDPLRANGASHNLSARAISVVRTARQLLAAALSLPGAPSVWSIAPDGITSEIQLLRGCFKSEPFLGTRRTLGIQQVKYSRILERLDRKRRRVGDRDTQAYAAFVHEWRHRSPLGRRGGVKMFCEWMKR